MKRYAVCLGMIVFVYLVLLTGCACDGGIRNMSDQWCDKHPEAAQ